MAFEIKDMSGILFTNWKKTSDKSPSLVGTTKVEGIEYQTSAWIKQGKKGKYMTLAFKVKQIQEPNDTEISDVQKAVEKEDGMTW